MMALERATSACRAPALPHACILLDLGRCTQLCLALAVADGFVSTYADITLTVCNIQPVSVARRATNLQDTYIAISPVPIVLPEHLIHSVTCASCGETRE